MSPEMTCPPAADVDEVCVESLSTLAAQDAWPVDTAAGGSAVFHHIHLLTLDGTHDCTVTVAVDPSTLEAIAEGMGLEAQDAPDVAGELTNQLAGAVKGLLRGEHQLTVPRPGGTSPGVEPCQVRSYDCAGLVTVVLSGPCACGS